MKALKLLVVALAATPLIASASIVQTADTLTYQLDNVFGYTNPVPNVPTGGWLTATFQDATLAANNNTVNLTLSAANIASDEFVTDWVFNLTTSKDLAFSVISNPADLAADTNHIIVANDALGLPHQSILGFDLRFKFTDTSTENFGKGEQIVVAITATTGTLNASDFFEVNHPAGSSSTIGLVGYYTAAEVAGIGTYNVTADLYPSEGGGGGSIPEPSTYAGLAGLAALALAYWRRRRAALFC